MNAELKSAWERKVREVTNEETGEAYLGYVPTRCDVIVAANNEIVELNQALVGLQQRVEVAERECIKLRSALLEIASLDPVEANANQARAIVKLVQIAESVLK